MDRRRSEEELVALGSRSVERGKTPVSRAVYGWSFLRAGNAIESTWTVVERD